MSGWNMVDTLTADSGYLEFSSFDLFDEARFFRVTLLAP